MPGFDGTGPQGAGSMTGGARGYCNPDSRRSTFAYCRGYGMGRDFRGGSAGSPGWGGHGYGRSFGRRGAFQPAGGWYSPVNLYGNPYTVNPEDELNMLKDEAAAIKNDLDAIYKRINEIEQTQE